MLNKLIFLTLFIIGTCPAAQAENCINSKYRYLERSRVKTKTIRICKLTTYYTSKNCMKNCNLISKLRDSRLTIPDVLQQIGSPHFKACHLIEGKPMILDILLNNEWLKKSFCFNENFDSFIDSELIYKILRNNNN